MPTGTPGRTHGIVGTYISGCRCDECCTANTAYSRELRARKRAA